MSVQYTNKIVECTWQKNTIHMYYIAEGVYSSLSRISHMQFSKSGFLIVASLGFGVVARRVLSRGCLFGSPARALRHSFIRTHSQ